MQHWICVGSLAHVNLWKEKFDKAELDVLHSDCTFTHCGDAVEWIDLREGTRGISRLRWPSAIHEYGYCFSESKALKTCDKYCSNHIGKCAMLYALCSMLYAINIILCKSFRKTSVGGEEAHDGVVLLIGWLKTTPNALTHLTRDFTIIPDP